MEKNYVFFYVWFFDGSKGPYKHVARLSASNAISSSVLAVTFEFSIYAGYARELCDVLALSDDGLTRRSHLGRP